MGRSLPRSTLVPYTTLFRSYALRQAHEIGQSAGIQTPLQDLVEKMMPLDQESRSEAASGCRRSARSEEHTSELQSRLHLVCRLLLEKKKNPRTRARKPPRPP